MFDGSSVQSDYAVLSRWWQQRLADPAPRVALYYNSASLHDGNRLVELKITVKIDGQDEGRFWGTLSSESKAEPIIGVIGADGKRVRMIGQGGSAIEGTLLDDGTLELFYTENRAGVSVAATNVLKKAK